MKSYMLVTRVTSSRSPKDWFARRLVTSLTFILRKLSNKEEEPLTYFLDGPYYDLVVEAVEKLSKAGFDEHGHRVFAKPSVVSMMGSMLRKCCELKKGLAVRGTDCDNMLKEVEGFLTLFQSDWADCMSCPASTAQKVKTYNKCDELPSTEDLVKLKDHINKQLDELTVRLQAEPTYAVWRALSEVVLAQLVVFNKRRGNEPATMLVSAYVNRPNWKDKSSKEVVSCLQPMEKVLMERMDLVQVPGKRNRRVPILITPEVRSAMNLLLHTRDDCSVPSQNRFFFATDSTAGHLDSWLVLHNCARDAGVTNPRLITSRSLRKYVATLAQVILSCF